MLGNTWAAPGANVAADQEASSVKFLPKPPAGYLHLLDSRGQLQLVHAGIWPLDRLGIQQRS